MGYRLQMADQRSGAGRRRLRSPIRIPARAQPFLRLAAIAILVVVADAATNQLSRHGGTFSFPTVTAVRVLVAPLILHFPLAGFVLSLEVDKWDWYWLGVGNDGDARQALYQHWDKAMDLVCLGMAAITVLKWPDLRVRNLALGSLAWPVFQREDYGIALPAGSTHRKAVNSTLLEMRADGSYDRIYEHYFGKTR